MNATSRLPANAGAIFPVSYLRMTSYAMVLFGIISLVAGVVSDLGPFFIVCGMLMIVAGVVKIIAVAIWQGAIFPSARLDKDDG